LLKAGKNFTPNLPEVNTIEKDFERTLPNNAKGARWKPGASIANG